MASERVIVFDGVCVLCSRWVGFVLRHDHRAEFKLAAMQASAGRGLLQRHGIDPDDPATFLVIDDGVPLTDTDALIHVLARFGFFWKTCALLLRMIPRSWRNAAYRYIASHRYRIFGKRETCAVPAPEHQRRFLS